MTTFVAYWIIKYHVDHRRKSPNKYIWLLVTTLSQAIAAASLLALQMFVGLIFLVLFIYVLVGWTPHLENSFDTIITTNLGSPDDFVEATLFVYIAYFELFYYVGRFIDFIVRFPYWMGVWYRYVRG